MMEAARKPSASAEIGIRPSLGAARYGSILINVLMESILLAIPASALALRRPLRPTIELWPATECTPRTFPPRSLDQASPWSLSPDIHVFFGS